MKLFHTSPAEINEINDNGRFGSFLFFSDIEYVMTAGQHITYTINISDDSLIDAEELFYHDDAEKLNGLVERVMAMTGCDEDTAEELISQREDIHSIDSEVDPEDLADISWDIQKIAAEAAAILGYRGVEMDDEQGRCYLVDMSGRAGELQAEV